MSRRATTRNEIPEEALLEGVPIWMRPSLERFIAQRVTGHDIAEVGRSWNANMHTVNAIERYLQIQLEGSTVTTTYQKVIAYVRDSDEKCLDIIEAILATDTNAKYLVSHLNTILTTSGSKWIATMQDSGYATLEERVSESAQNALAMALQESDTTTQQFLKTAWGNAFGRNPNPSSAYSNSIKAIEAIAWPTITPNDNKATLGTMLGEIRASSSKWKTAISGVTTDQGISAVKDIMQLVWDGQTDRHGTAHPVAPSQEAAEQAVLCAVVICNFFNRSLVVKV